MRDSCPAAISPKIRPRQAGESPPSFPALPPEHLIRKFIPGALALGLVATTIRPDPGRSPAKSEATTPPIEVPAKPKLDPAVIKTDSSYALGFRTGSTFTQQFGRFGVGADDIQQENFIKGFMAAVKGDKPGLDEEKLQAAMQALGDLLQAREKETAAANLEAGKKFLEENGKREGVTTTKSGLQYEVLAKGGDEKYVAPRKAPRTTSNSWSITRVPSSAANSSMLLPQASPCR